MKNVHYARQLAYYLDHYMRVGFKNKSKEEIENILDDIITAYEHLNDKIFLYWLLKKDNEW